MDLLDFQEQSNLFGSVYEVGVFRGKYFSTLVRSALCAKNRVVGVDNFGYVQKDIVIEDLNKQIGLGSLISDFGLDIQFVEKRSVEISERQMFDFIGTEARFISIDGSHQYGDVMWDLHIAEKMVAPHGIIAMDDFLNPISLGVTFAICEFLKDRPELVPFASITNKLFLARPFMVEQYRNVVESAILADTDEKSRLYQRNLKTGHIDNIEAAFKGFKVLAVRL